MLPTPRRAVRRSGSIRRSARKQRRPTETPAQRIAPLAEWPLDECLITQDYSGQGGFTVLWIRRHPHEARYVSAVIRADSGHGIEQAWSLIDAGPAATWSMIEDIRCGEPLVRTDPSVARQLLDRAERAAPQSSDPDWTWMSQLLVADRSPSPTFSPIPPADA